MKQYRITVNGREYQVSVEEIKPAPNPEQVQPIKPVPVPPTPQISRPTPPPQPPARTPQATAKPAPTPGDDRVVPAPMPGKVLALKVKVGQEVKAGAVLLILEAMKMENEIVAQRDGIIKEIYVSEGANVEFGSPLLSFT